MNRLNLSTADLLRPVASIEQDTALNSLDFNRVDGILYGTDGEALYRVFPDRGEITRVSSFSRELGSVAWSDGVISKRPKSGKSFSPTSYTGYTAVLARFSRIGSLRSLQS